MISSLIKKALKCVVRLTAAFLFCLSHLDAAYIQVTPPHTVVNGGIAITGNTLGLDKRDNLNEPGQDGSIGAFIEQSTTIPVNTFPSPPGTTLTFADNSSSGYLDLPPGSVVIYAELVWSGSYGYDPAVPLSVVNGANVTLITPDSGTHPLSPRVDTAQNVADTSPQGHTGGFYVRSQNVTTIVQTQVANFVNANPSSYYSAPYITKGVPGTAIANENNLNCAGWTLVVAYSNPNMLASTLAIFVGCELTNPTTSTIAQVTGFVAPSTGTVQSRLFISAVEGDAGLSGDQLHIGVTSPPTTVLSGTNNPANNFFASQINTLLLFTTDVLSGKLVQTGSGLLDMRGSFGTLNASPTVSTPNAGGNVIANRQGYDITSINISGDIANNQTSFYAEGTTNQDVYAIGCLAVQLQIEAPILQTTKISSVPSVSGSGDPITFTSTFMNLSGTSATDSPVIFVDMVPVGLTFTPSSFTYQYNVDTPVNLPSVDEFAMAAGVSIPIALNPGDTLTVTFDTTVGAIKPTYVNMAFLNYTYESAVFSGSAATPPVTVTGIFPPPPMAVDQFYTIPANMVLTVGPPGVLVGDTGVGIQATFYQTPTADGGVVSNTTLGGSFQYTPVTGFSGTNDTFTYTITDIVGQPASAVVHINVTPVANNYDESTPENTPLVIPASMGVLSNDIGSGLSVSNFTMPTNGSVNVLSNGAYTYSPNFGFSGEDSFTYTCEDSSGQLAMGMVSITVVPPAPDDCGVTNANQTLNGNLAMYFGVISSYDAMSVAGGTVVILTDTSTTYTYTPPANFSGIDSFTYTTLDDGIYSTGTVSIAVLPIAIPDASSTPANTTLDGTSVLANDIGINLSVTPFTEMTPQNGTVTMRADGTYTYEPPNNFAGTDSFRYCLSLNSFSSFTCAELTPPCTLVTITVEPMACEDSVIACLNTTLVSPQSAIYCDQAIMDVTFVVTSPTLSVNGFPVSMNTNGTYLYGPPTILGPDSFSYTVMDSAGGSAMGTVNINVITCGATAPTNFFGCIHKCKFLNGTTYNATMTWTPVNLSTVVAYIIYLNGEQVAKISAGSPLEFQWCSKSKSVFNGFTITALYINGTQSAPVPMIKTCAQSTSTISSLPSAPIKIGAYTK